MSETAPKAEQLLADYKAFINDRDVSKIPEVFAESFVAYDPGVPGGETHGHEGLETWLNEMVASFSDIEATLDEVLFGDGVIMMEWTLTGTHDGEFNGIPPTQQEMTLRGMSIIQIEDDKIAEERVYYNVPDLLDQLDTPDE